MKLLAALALVSFSASVYATEAIRKISLEGAPPKAKMIAVADSTTQPPGQRCEAVAGNIWAEDTCFQRVEKFEPIDLRKSNTWGYNARELLESVYRIDPNAIWTFNKYQEFRWSGLGLTQKVNERGEKFYTYAAKIEFYYGMIKQDIIVVGDVKQPDLRNSLPSVVRGVEDKDQRDFRASVKAKFDYQLADNSAKAQVNQEDKDRLLAVATVVNAWISAMAPGTPVAALMGDPMTTGSVGPSKGITASAESR